MHYQYLQEFFETEHRRDRNDQSILIFKEKIVSSILLKFNLTLMRQFINISKRVYKITFKIIITKVYPKLFFPTCLLDATLGQNSRNVS